MQTRARSRNRGLPIACAMRLSLALGALLGLALPALPAKAQACPIGETQLFSSGTPGDYPVAIPTGIFGGGYNGGGWMGGGGGGGIGIYDLGYRE